MFIDNVEQKMQRALPAYRILGPFLSVLSFLPISFRRCFKKGDQLHNALVFFFWEFNFNHCFYFVKVLPMVWCWSCLYFEAFSTYLKCVATVATMQGHIIHYLSDFLFIGPADCVREAENGYPKNYLRTQHRLYDIFLKLSENLWD